MTTTSTKRGVFALMVAHCAGMVDLVALPVWVGSLIQHRGLAPAQAGGLVTVFLVGAVLASLAIAPRLGRLPGRGVVVAGFALAAAAFAALSLTTDLATMGVLHGVAGLAAGSALSVTHGTIARSASAHRLFALVGIALGVFAVIFLGGAAQLVQIAGTAALFGAFAAVMAIATVTSLLAFPTQPAAGASATVAAQPLPRALWFGIAGICGMGLVQSMTFSFLERVGRHRGLEADEVTAVLIVLGLVNLSPAALAALLEKRWPAHRVMLAGPGVQAALCVTIMTAPGYAPYAAAASVFAAVMIFTHTFAFGALARLDPSGRALAATPAMIMAGAAVGPLLGGLLVQSVGYVGIAVAAVAVAILSTACFLQVSRGAVPATAGAVA